MISEVQPDSLDVVWLALRPEIQKALSVGAGRHMTEAHYYQALKRGDMFMWASHEGGDVHACGIFSIQQHPNGKTLFVELLAGKSMKWLSEVEPLLKQYRDAIGATTIEAMCRPGLAKKLTNWRNKACLMELI